MGKTGGADMAGSAGEAKKEYKSPHGKRHTCWSCGKKFYDMNKEEAVCPSCGKNQAEAPDAVKEKAPPKSSRSRLEVPPVEEGVIDVEDDSDSSDDDLDTLDLIDSDDDAAASDDDEDDND